MKDKFGVKTNDATVYLFLECYDGIEMDEIRSCTELFKLISENTLEFGNYVDDGFIKRGVKILPAVKKHRANNMMEVRPIQMYTDSKDLLFFKSLQAFADALPYLNADDRFCLDNLFDGMARLGKGIGEIIQSGDKKVLPVYNYKKSVIEKKAPVKK